MTTVKIELFSDYICPWCYLGDVRLSKIRQKLAPEIDLNIEVKPYLLYPEMPKGGWPKTDFAKKTKPGMGKSLRYEAEIEGIQFNYKNIDRIPSSRKAHQLACLLGDSDQKYQFSQKILHSYFEKGQNIEDISFLIDQAHAVGLDSSTIDSFKKDDHFGSEKLELLLSEAREHFVSIVPTIRLDEKFMVLGLQPVDVYEKYIRRTAKLQNTQ